MRKRPVLVLLLVAIVAVVGAFLWYLRGERRVPAGQAPLTYLRQTSLDTLRADFNAHADKVRIVVLLSPT
jgi:membrane protein DedA with SNARE-associated domain